MDKHLTAGLGFSIRLAYRLLHIRRSSCIEKGMRQISGLIEFTNYVSLLKHIRYIWLWCSSLLHIQFRTCFMDGWQSKQSVWFAFSPWHCDVLFVFFFMDFPLSDAGGNNLHNCIDYEIEYGKVLWEAITLFVSTICFIVPLFYIQIPRHYLTLLVC